MAELESQPRLLVSDSESVGLSSLCECEIGDKSDFVGMVLLKGLS